MKLTECLNPDRGRTPKKTVGQNMFVDLGPVIPATQEEVRRASRFTASCALDAGDALLLLDVLDLLEPLKAPADGGEA